MQYIIYINKNKYKKYLLYILDNIYRIVYNTVKRKREVKCRTYIATERRIEYG